MYRNQADGNVLDQAVAITALLNSLVTQLGMESQADKANVKRLQDDIQKLNSENSKLRMAASKAKYSAPASRQPRSAARSSFSSRNSFNTSRNPPNFTPVKPAITQPAPKPRRSGRPRKSASSFAFPPANGNGAEVGQGSLLDAKLNGDE